MMTRRNFVAGVAATSGALLAPRATSATGTRPPNVLMLVSDDQAFLGHGFMREPSLWPGGLGCDFANRFPWPSTPAMDALAEGGIAFHRGHVEITECTRSRKSLWTGLKQRDLALASSNFANVAHPTTGFDSIPIALYRAGYLTCGIGKCQIGYEWDQMGSENKRIGQIVGDGKDSISEANRCNLVFLERLLLDARAQDKPWMFAFCPLVPHQPYYYPGHGIPGVPGPEYDFSGADLSILDAPYGPGQSVTDGAFRSYLASAVWWSACVGTILAKLAAHGYLENTLILFTSDHGASLELSKGTMTESGLRQPILAYYEAGPDSRLASLPASGLNDALVGAIDLFPTVLEAVGIPREEWRNDFPDAKSFLGLAQAPTAEATAAHRALFFSQRAADSDLQVTDGTYRLWTTRAGVPQKFYCLTGDATAPADPFETHNLHTALTPAQAARRAEMLAALNAWRVG